MTLKGYIPQQLSPMFQKMALDPVTQDPCFPTTTVEIKHNGESKLAVYPASAKPLRLIAEWLGGSKVLGFVKPIMNYVLNDTSVPPDARFVIA